VGAEDCEPYLIQKRDLGWLLKLKDVDPDAAKIRGHCFDELPPPPGRVVARVRLKNGVLATHRLEGDLAWHDTDPATVGLVHFEGQDPGQSRAAARELVLDLKFEGAVEATFVASDLSNPDLVRKPIVIRGKADAEVVEVRISNVPLPEALIVGHYHDPLFSGRHFEHFYRLSGTTFNRKPVHPDTGGDLLCPPAEGQSGP
jgi:hypothetical protein